MQKSFALRIKEARQKLGLSQRQAAKKWGFPQATINAWERGERNPAGLYGQKLQRILKRIETEEPK